MNELKLGKHIIYYRRKAGITQEQLAAYIGVSKSSVSKWETGTSFPDIVLLPQLAALFNISVDELMGYEAQLTKDAILTIYRELSDMFVKDPQEAYIKCREYVKKYYACFPFLYQMALLLLNHYTLLKEPDTGLNFAIELCQRVHKECDDASLIKDSITLEAMMMLSQNKAMEVLDLLGEQIKPLSQESELIAAAYDQLGNKDKTKEIMQVCIYQHLLFFIQDSINYMMMNQSDQEVCQATLKRLMVILSLYHIDDLHFNTAIMFYITYASIALQHQDKETALDMIERYCDTCIKNAGKHYQISGDDYFTMIDAWLKELEVNSTPVRSSDTVKESILAVLEMNPLFDSLRDEFRFKTCIDKVKAI